MTSFAISDALTARARRAEALIAERPSLFLTGYEPANGAPRFVRSARGSRVIDVDGNEFIDLLMGYGSVILGHAHPAVQDAVHAALANGANPTLLSEVQIDLAERIQRLVPNAERVTFLKTGSDAVAAAVRLARAIKRKRYVLRWGQHGWHDWCCTESPGVLEDAKRYTIGFKYDDIEHLRSQFQRYKGDVACVVMMPYAEELPSPGYLQDVRNLCHEYDALLVFDEVRSGFRIALGGAQEFYNVDADLVAFSKAMGNGYPISAIAGPAAHMAHVLDLQITITFYRDPISISAALATLSELENGVALKRIAALGQTLKSHISALASQWSIPVTLVGQDSSPSLKFQFDDSSKNGRAIRMFCSAMIGEGIILHPLNHWFLSSSLGPDEEDRLLQATTVSVKKTAKLLG